MGKKNRLHIAHRSGMRDMRIAKKNMKIDPYNYPLIIILAFVIGFILAMALGFRPEHGSRESQQILTTSLVVQFVEWDKA